MTEKVEIHEFRPEDMPKSCTMIIVGPPGSGKCFGQGTEVLMADGSCKTVESIEIGDKVMGDDATPRNVKQLFTGKKPLYKITQKWGVQRPYLVTHDHMLCLKYKTKPKLVTGDKNDIWIEYPSEMPSGNGLRLTRIRFSTQRYGTRGAALFKAIERMNELISKLTDEYREVKMTVEDYAKMDKSLKVRCVSYRSSECIQQSHVSEVDPYMLGLWLGDYSSQQSVLTFQRNRDESKKFIDYIQKHNLKHNRHIPLSELTCKLSDAKKIVAGFIDSAGFSTANSYSISTKSETLRNNLIQICMSIGCMVTVHEDVVTLFGSVIRKLPVQSTIKVTDFTPIDFYYDFDLEYVGEGPYFGFETDGNHLFLLSDFTVVHNCLGKDTPVLMFDGTVKMVQNIRTGDKLAGDDFKPRTVLGTTSGMDFLYRVKQKTAMDYVVNSVHPLCLIDEEENVHEIEAQLFHRYPNEENLKGYRFDRKNGMIEKTDVEIEKLPIGRYYGFEIDGNHRFLLGDGTVTHNTNFMEYIAYVLRHRYPVARAFIGTEGAFMKFSEIFGPLFVSNYYDEEEQKQHVKRQRLCIFENGADYPGNRAINILDDVSDDPKIYKSKVMRQLFKNGSQHYQQLFMLGSQYAIDMPPDIRKSVSYVVIFREPEANERDKLYANFGGICGSRKNFDDLMDQLTGNFTCLVLKKRSQSNKLEHNVFYFKAKNMEGKKWKFGCKEFREWNNKRYDKNYVIDFDL